MKFKTLAVLAALMGVGLCCNQAYAVAVTVSSSTVTSIAGSDSGRAVLVIYNNSSNLVYYSKTSAGATAGAGMVLPSSTTVTLDGYKGTVYGLAGAGAPADVRTFSTSR